MISCTEFIPAYSELFKFIDRRSGRQAVYDYWDWNFDPSESPLERHLDRSGLAGCWNYWYGIYTEEACDNTMHYNPDEGWYTSCMHHCPSKGRFCKLGYMTPFEEYCKHCGGYDASLEKHGLKRYKDYRGEDTARCRTIIVDHTVFRGNPAEMLDTMYRCEMEGCKYPEDPAACPLNRKGSRAAHFSSGELKYLHPYFHVYMERAMNYIHDKYGEEGLREYLAQYVAAFHKPRIEAITAEGLAPLETYLREIYAAEAAEDALTLNREGNELWVHLAYSPAVRFLNEAEHKPSQQYLAGINAIYEELARQSGLECTVEQFDPDTGAAVYRFVQRK